VTYYYSWNRAGMQPKYYERKWKEKTGSRTIKKRKGWFSSEMVEMEEPVYKEAVEKIPTGEYSDIYIDIDALAKNITEACNKFEKRGYEIVKIIEVIGGRYNHRTTWSNNGGGAGYGYGYSVTDGVVIIARDKGKTENSPDPTLLTYNASVTPNGDQT